ncbi:hypothetical protein, partial [Escherichia coli]|uniref:hypothetical protein n=1 Tax=Escherichia coli TaxID=562 RepID=UPI0028DDA40C
MAEDAQGHAVAQEGLLPHRVTGIDPRVLEPGAVTSGDAHWDGRTLTERRPAVTGREVYGDYDSYDA